MKTNDFVRMNGFSTDVHYQATVRNIKDNQVIFDIVNCRGIVYTAIYHILGGHINPHTIFRRQEKIIVKIYTINRHNILTVMPVSMPTDDFIISHPVGSIVDGIIDKIDHKGMRIYIMPNVYIFAPRCNHARTSCKVKVKIKKYKPIKEILGFVIA